MTRATTGVKARVFDATGTAKGDEFLVNTETIGVQANPTITALPNGDFVITWRTFDGVDDTSGSGVKARVFDATGTAKGDEFLVNTETNSESGFRKHHRPLQR